MSEILEPHPLALLLQRYSYGYTAAHDFSVCREIMVEDYELLMGEHRLHGRDAAYIPATQRQYRQFPTLGFTVHDLIVGQDRAALHFTEHGKSALHKGSAAWSGISMYRWNGERLTQCRVEQDYYGRRRQQRTGRTNPIEQPAIDPWATRPEATDEHTEAMVRKWLDEGGLAEAPHGALDDEYCAPNERVVLDDAQTDILDMFEAGRRAVFHVRCHGRYQGGLPNIAEHLDAPLSLYTTGIAEVREDEVRLVRAVTDRLAAERRLLLSEPNPHILAR